MNIVVPSITEGISRGLSDTLFIRIVRWICTNAHLNILTHFLWEVPTEPQHSSLCTAAAAWTTSITIPQRVFKGYSIVILSSTSDSRLNNNPSQQKQVEPHQGTWHRDSCRHHHRHGLCPYLAIVLACTQPQLAEKCMSCKVMQWLSRWLSGSQFDRLLHSHWGCSHHEDH